MQRASQLPCRQNLQSKSKQIETNTGSFCKHSQGLPVFCMESVLSLEQAKKSLQPRHQGQAAGNSRRRGQADCRAGRIRKVKCKQIETNTGSSCNTSQGLPVFCMESIDAWRTVFGTGEKSRCDQGMCDRGQAAGNFRCRGQANCCAGRICKVKPKQIKTETGSSCKNSQELPAFDCCMVV